MHLGRIRDHTLHFPGGKEELASAAASLSGEEMRKALDGVIRQAETLPDVLHGVCGVLASRLEESEFLDGCPVATLALEMASRSPAIQSTCESVYREWEAVIQESMKKHGLATEQLEGFATFVLSSIEGALLLCRAYQSTEPLHDTARSLAHFAALLQSTPSV